MGVGGLLTEIASRPQPREAGRGANARKIDVGAVILAAGRSTRMGGPNKLLSKFEGKPLIRKVVDTVCGSNAKDPIVVTGHQAELIDAALSGAGVARAFNPDYSEGFATSLITGLDAVSQQVAGALVILGDMPGVATGDLNRMIGAFRDNGGAAVVRATHNGKRGNPVIIPRAMFGEVKKLRGDTGARHLIEANDFPVVDIEIGTAASVDVDTPETLAEAGGKF
jgi:molybdenum cofactor cytidylyltransferase